MKSISFVAIAVLAPGAAFAADFSGTWRLDNVFRGTTSVINCTIVQSGDMLSGSCKPQVEGIAPTDLAGVVDGATAKWGYDVVFNGTPARVDYEGEIASDGTMKGTLFRSGSPSPFTATKL